MKRRQCGVAVLAVLGLVGAVWAEPDVKKDEPPLRMELDLVDGSRVIGVPGLDSVAVETAYAKVKLPLAQIAGMAVGEDHESVSFDLLNGDKLKGVLNLGPIPLETVFGKITVAVEHVRKIRILPVGLDGAGPANGLIAWYNFNDGTASDASENKRNGILRGAKPAPDRSNRPDAAMSFDGKGAWIEVPSSSVYDALTEVTIALWVCPADVQGRGGIRGCPLVTKQPSGSLSSQHGPSTSNHGGQFEFNLNARDGGWDASFGSQVSPGMCTEGHFFPLKSLISGQWRHLVVTASRAENRVRVYLDGSKVGDLVYTEQAAVGKILTQPNTEPLRIGKRKDADFSSDGNLYFAGSMDDIRIYNRVLSDEEVRTFCGVRK